MNMNDLAATAAPIAPSERIVSLDFLRGIAVLGILIMNIQSFSMIEAAYLNPSASGDLTGLNKWVSILSHFDSLFQIRPVRMVMAYTDIHETSADTRGCES